MAASTNSSPIYSSSLSWIHASTQHDPRPPPSPRLCASWKRVEAAFGGRLGTSKKVISPNFRFLLLKAGKEEAAMLLRHRQDAASKCS